MDGDRQTCIITTFEQPGDRASSIHWVDVRCAGCRRLLQKMEERALRPGKRIQIKCSHCKVMNYSIGT